MIFMPLFFILLRGQRMVSELPERSIEWVHQGGKVGSYAAYHMGCHIRTLVGSHMGSYMGI